MKTPVAKTRLIGPQISREEFIAEHLFFYLAKGALSGYYGGKDYTLAAGEYGIIRKNRLGRENESKEKHKVEKVIFVFDEPFLKKFEEKHKIIVPKSKSAEPFFGFPNNELIPNFIHSLQPYYDAEGKMNNAFFDVKREELLLILLQLKPELSGVFFDYGIPAKIDLAAFMNRNYKFSVSMKRLTYLTGRSISAFKRDFKQIFNDTPNHWLVQKRLQEAHFLMEKEAKKPSEIYFDLGFKDLSHFSFAFKKLYGLAPTELARRQKIPDSL